MSILLKVKNYLLLAVFAGAAFLSAPASAGHLFTQAAANTPINLTSGQGIQITQLTFEGTGTNGNVSLNFNGDWGAGDAIKITIGGYVQTFTYSAPLAGTTQVASALVVNDPTLAAAGISKNASMQWTVVATAGTFTFTGYRIYVTNGTFNGTGADTIRQEQVVNEDDLDGNDDDPPPPDPAPAPAPPPSFVPVATAHNVGLARQLDALNGNATGQLGTVIAVVSAMTSQSQQLALKLLSPETSQAIGQSAVNTAAAALDTVQLRLDSVRTGVNLVRNSNHHHDAAHSDPRMIREESQSPYLEGLSSGDDTLKRNLWLKAFGGKGSQDAKDGFAGFDDDIYGMMLGYDDRVGRDWLLGVALGYAKTDVDLTDFRAGDGADVETYQLTGYFGRSFGKWYLDGMVTYAYQDYATARDTHLTGVALGSFKGNLYGLRLLAGVPLALRDDVTVTPYGGIDTNRVEQRAYTETGAGAMSLNVTGNSVNRVRSILGTEVATVVNLSGGSVLRPSAKLNWRHEFNDDGVNTVTSLTGGGSEFETIGQAVNRNIYGLSLRLNWERTEASNIAFEVTGEAGHGYRNLSGQVMGGWRF